jgi:hypothetical protein
MKIGSREKKSQVRHSKKLRFSVPLFGKEGKGDFFGGVRRELFGELLFQGTSQFAVKERGGNNVQSRSQP